MGLETDQEKRIQANIKRRRIDPVPKDVKTRRAKKSQSINLRSTSGKRVTARAALNLKTKRSGRDLGQIAPHPIERNLRNTDDLDQATRLNLREGDLVTSEKANMMKRTERLLENYRYQRKAILLIVQILPKKK